MATSSPFSWLNDLAASFGRNAPPLPFKLPDWVVNEGMDRIGLLLNHVLQTEPEAMARLRRCSGQTVRLQWRDFNLTFKATPAGLVERVPIGADAKADLNVVVNENSPLELARLAMQGEKPPVRIDGDVQLAAEVNWLIDHVRWDMEDDLAKIVGDAPAHLIASTLSSATQALRQFVQSVSKNSPFGRKPAE